MKSIRNQNKSFSRLPFNVEGFKDTIWKIKNCSKESRQIEIEKLLKFENLHVHHLDKITKKMILADRINFEYAHEKHTAIKLTAVDFHVLFSPFGFFKRHEKKFDVFLLRNHILLEADLKCINSKNPDTIAKRIKDGSGQASRVILDIHADIEKSVLIDGMKMGCERNRELKQILLFYRTRFHTLNKDQILSKKIFNVLK